MLNIKNLKVESSGKEILKSLSLEVKKGEIHAIMGPNGSGKSTLSKVVAGSSEYEVKGGSINLESGFESKDLLKMAPHERARAGLFVAFQYPLEIEGITNFNFLKNIFDVACKSKGVKSLGTLQFKKFLEEKIDKLKMPSHFLERDLNSGFSGGEKKRNEILQMAILNPRVAFLDETDSGLDVDSLKIVSNGINELSNDENSIVLITHYERILKYIHPHFVHILYKGKIIKTGGKDLASRVEKEGYGDIIREYEEKEKGGGNVQ